MSARHFDASRIRALRRAAELTQGDVAAAVGGSVPAVISWEKGKSVPSPEKLPALARVLGADLDTLFPRAGLPDLADLRADAGYVQSDTKAFTQTLSAVPVAHAERGKTRLAGKYHEPLAAAYRVSVPRLLAAQDRSFGMNVPEPTKPEPTKPEPAKAEPGSQVPGSLAEKIRYLEQRMFNSKRNPPSDAEIARGINSYANSAVISEEAVGELRRGTRTTAPPVIREGLAQVYGVASPSFFQCGDSADEAVRQVLAGLKLLALSEEGTVRRVAARGVGEEGLPPELVDLVEAAVKKYKLDAT
ncbi:helix-turn-helix domain-containing protein (plasmid) [Streptomyces sp. HU2014]|uniref:helix-turn-helix domain-containing protein n=1 Tax=Streptomyces sp. HU2014 TaxID=2939414 RepID=UPI00200EB19E|nr:helix-turn-helix domain-containing protein [Streptomyces sp. HU2014]UQI49712.1 helix-turn-helix domain-containing protein [Streptomyces sp. HU2014]